MTALDLFRYVTENTIEWHYADNGGEEDVVIFPFFYQLKEFTKLLSPSSLDEDGIGIALKDGYVAIWIKEICEYYDIEIKEVFKKGKKP